MERDGMGPKGGDQGVCATPSFFIGTLNMAVTSLQEQKQRVWLTLLFRLFLYMVLFLMHHLVQHGVERGGNSS